MRPDQLDTMALIHLWVAGASLGAAMLGLALMLVGVSLPVRSRVGGRLFAAGVLGAIGAVVIYLLYAAASVITVVVMRS